MTFGFALQTMIAERPTFRQIAKGIQLREQQLEMSRLSESARTKQGSKAASGIERSVSQQTRAKVLEVARAEFAAKGLAGARIDEIAAKANINKQAIYYHFGNKEDLFTATIELCYAGILKQHEAYAQGATIKPPKLALQRVIEHMFDRIARRPEVVVLIMDENRYNGRHLKNKKLISSSDDPMVDHIRSILKEGEATGEFVTGIDPEQLFLDIISLCIFYFSNIYTLSAVMDRDLSTPAAARERRKHIIRQLLAAVEAR